MTRCLMGLVVVLGLQCCGLGEIPKGIFEDDWTPAAPKGQADADPARLAVPAAAAQAEKRTLVRTRLYKDQIAQAKSRGQKAELAKDLLTVAQGTANDAVGKFVLLAEAKEMGINSEDPSIAFKCVDEMGKGYEINYPAMKVELFNTLAAADNDPLDCKPFVEGLNRWAQLQMLNDRFDMARRAGEIALNVARKNRAARLTNRLLLRQRQMNEVEAASSSIKGAMASLAAKPDDPAASLQVGRFYCFAKGDWKEGLPRLAAGGDAGLKALASKEVAGDLAGDEQMAVADGWWDVGDKEKGFAQERIHEHAIALYAAALPNLKGLPKAKAEQRIAKYAAGDVVELCEIVVTPSLPVLVRKLAPGSERLSGGYRPVFDAVDEDLVRAQYLVVPWQSTPSYKVTVTKGGMLYGIACGGDKPPKSDLKWEKANGMLAGVYLGGKYAVKVESGETFEVSGFETGLVAKEIGLEKK